MLFAFGATGITWGVRSRARRLGYSPAKPILGRKDNNIYVYNLGISGDNTIGFLIRIEVEAKSRKPNFIIFSIGINDAQFIHSTNSLRISAG